MVTGPISCRTLKPVNGTPKFKLLSVQIIVPPWQSIPQKAPVESIVNRSVLGPAPGALCRGRRLRDRRRPRADAGAAAAPDGGGRSGVIAGRRPSRGAAFTSRARPGRILGVEQSVAGRWNPTREPGAQTPATAAASQTSIWCLTIRPRSRRPCAMSDSPRSRGRRSRAPSSPRSRVPGPRQSRPSPL
jgi:hypothetical protein